LKSSPRTHHRIRFVRRIESRAAPVTLCAGFVVIVTLMRYRRRTMRELIR
jgi:hypothetical protein